MTAIPAVAKLEVTIVLDAENLYEAERTLDDLLRPYEDDDRLVTYRVNASDWYPRQWTCQV